MNRPTPLSTATLPVPKSISRSPLRRGFVLIPLALVGFVLSPAPKAFGVSPPPDAGNAGANTAERQNPLQSLTGGIYNTALGFQTLENTVTGLQAAVRTNGQAGRSLGTFILGPTTTQGCPSGFTCNTFTVICPGIATITGVIADQKPVGQIQGMVMFFSDEAGTTWWSGTSTGVPAFFESLLDSGFELVQIQWLDNGWLLSLPGVQSGEELLASRPATVIKWVHDNMYGPLGLQPSVGQCGFCVTGSSGGAAQITYALSSYGIDNIVNAAIPTSGPPMAAISKGCLQQPGYAYNPGKTRLIDESYGFRGAQVGPCAAHDPSFTDTWIANSVETGGTKYNYPTTRMQIIVGGQDSAYILNHANDYFQVLLQAQQPMLTWQLVPNMAHVIEDSANGLSALYTALTTANTTGNDSTANGSFALLRNTTGKNNIALGFSAGANLSTGSNNIDIGNAGGAGDSKKIRICISGIHANTYVAGITGVTVAGGVGVIIDGNGHLGTVVSSERFKDEIKPMDNLSEAILALKPGTFRYKHELDPEGIPQFGLVAEQVEKVNPDLVVRDAEGKVFTVRYEAVKAMLLNEFLREHRDVQELKSTAAKQEATIARQQKQIEALTTGLQKVSDQLELSKPVPQMAGNDR